MFTNWLIAQKSIHFYSIDHWNHNLDIKYVNCFRQIFLFHFSWTQNQYRSYFSNNWNYWLESIYLCIFCQITIEFSRRTNKLRKVWFFYFDFCCLSIKIWRSKKLRIPRSEWMAISQVINIFFHRFCKLMKWLSLKELLL